MKFDCDWFDRVKADVDGTDFTSPDARRAFSDRLRRDYTARELYMFREFVEQTPCGWDWGAFARAGSDPRACRLLWCGALEDAQSLIVQIRANGGGAITRPLCETESGEKVPNPEMLWDLPDGLWDLPIDTLRANAARAMENAATIQAVADKVETDGDATRSLIRAYYPNRPADYQVTQEHLSEILGAKNCPKDRKTIQRWEKYLQTNGKEGTKPPEGYTLQTRLTPATAAAWVDSYAAQENGKLKTKLSFDARFGRT